MSKPIGVLKDGVKPAVNGEERIWVVKWVGGAGEVRSFKVYRDVGYWGVVVIYDVDGEPIRRLARVVFRSEDGVNAREAANKLLSILRRRTIGSIEPRKLLAVLAVLHDVEYNEPLYVEVVKDTMDVHYNGEVMLHTYKALLR